MYIRTIFKEISKQIKKGKSILLLGPRQVGKTTLAQMLQFDLKINLAMSRERLKYEKNPGLLSDAIQSLGQKRPLVFIDEVQKVPSLLNEIQVLIDERAAQFFLTGSSARKLRSEIETNLIPGRVVNLQMDPLSVEENQAGLDEIINFGQLPAISQERENEQKSLMLRSYVENYIEDEIRKETRLRNIANYSRFLELAAIQSNHITNFSEISQELGPTVATIQSYYQVLEDTLFAYRVDPYLKKSRRKKLAKSSRYLFFDLGVRRVCAGEGTRLLPDRRGELFEHLVGNEILKWIHARALGAKLFFWKDLDGPEVDWLIEFNEKLLPIEVKMKEKIKSSDARHLKVFMAEYSHAQSSLIVNNSKLNFELEDGVHVLGFNQLHDFLSSFFLRQR